MTDPDASLDELWRARKARISDEHGAPLHFGDADAEARAARAGAVLIDRSARDFLRIRGDKVRGVLQGQLSNEIASLGAGAGCYATHLDAKGRMISDVVVQVEDANSVLLEVERGMGAELARRFAPFAMLDDLEIERLDGERRLLVVGPEAADCLGELLAGDGLADLPAYAFVRATFGGEAVVVSARAETGERGHQLAAPVATLARLARELLGRGIRPGGSEAFEILRIEAGTPVWGRDMDGRNLPPECGIPHAVSYTKGCYVGQETVARMKTYGQANKGLRGLRTTSLMPPETVLETREGKTVGRVTSSVWSPHLEAPIALGYVQRDHLAAGTALIGRAGDEIFEVEVQELPFVPRRFTP